MSYLNVYVNHSLRRYRVALRDVDHRPFAVVRRVVPRGRDEEDGAPISMTGRLGKSIIAAARAQLAKSGIEPTATIFDAGAFEKEIADTFEGWRAFVAPKIQLGPGAEGRREESAFGAGVALGYRIAKRDMFR